MNADVKQEVKEIKSYVVRFEEMIESRKAAIENCENVINEQTSLVEVLQNHDENQTEKKFTNLIEQINSQIIEMRNYISNLKEKNVKTENLIDILRSNKNFDSVCTLVCDELEIFKDNTQEK